MARKTTTKSKGSVDKWKLKKMYDVIAPDIFNNVIVGTIVATDPETLKGRTINATLSKLVNSNQHHIQVKLRVTEVSGFKAMTKIDGMELSRAYIGSQIFGGSDLIEYVFKVETQDGETVRVKMIISTRRKAHDAQKKQVRKIAEEILAKTASRSSVDQLIQEIIFGKAGSQIFNKGKKIMPLGRAEIRRAEVLKRKA